LYCFQKVSDSGGKKPRRVQLSDSSSDEGAEEHAENLDTTATKQRRPSSGRESGVDVSDGGNVSSDVEELVMSDDEVPAAPKSLASKMMQPIPAHEVYSSSSSDEEEEVDEEPEIDKNLHSDSGVRERRSF